MKKTIRLNESDLHRIVKEAVARLLNENYMSDDDIAAQYSDIKIMSFDIKPLRNSEGWKGYFELEFPNADNVDYDDYMVNDFICYDKDGKSIGWDYWMPDKQTNMLQKIIRDEIRKRL